jgi:subtilisin family serine protease
MNMKKYHKIGIGFIVALLIFSLVSAFTYVDRSMVYAQGESTAQLEAGEDVVETSSSTTDYPVDYQLYDEWILKWNEGYEQPKSDQFEVLSVDEERQLMLIQLKVEVKADEWYSIWSKRKDIEYIEPNYKLKISALPNDPLYEKQGYLKQIRAEEAWQMEKKTSKAIVAVLDTGIDLNHPDLKANLVKGINLIDSKKPPQDDNGHGTQIAGVLGAVANNNQGIAGVLWSAKIMPVKVLPKEGEGSPYITSQGIYQSIDQGASIVLLSLGGPIFSKTLQDAVEYAEEQGVIVIAATGNEGARVNYPAAFPTVLAVGAVNSQDKTVSYSNSGPEVGVVAPGNVYTTRMNGKYGSHSGTSMATPQVAGLAALLLDKYPNMKPSELRNHIMYTSTDVHQQGWDVQTGHGRIDIARALQTSPIPDIFEPNDRIGQAAVFPVETMVRAQLSNSRDIDWYQIDAPYRGKIRLQLTLDIAKTSGIDVTYFPGGQQEQSFLYNVKKDREIILNVPKGRSYISLQYNHNERRTMPIQYDMINTFTIYEDDQQPNNSRAQATKLIGDGGSITGTIHQDNGNDWYYFDAPKKGQIDVQVTVDTIRLDPVLTHEKPNGSIVRVDDGNIHNGQEERLVSDIESGRHYFKIHHYYNHKVNAEYSFRFSYKPYFEDINEANNSKETATTISFTQKVEGNIMPVNDKDWYHLQVSEEQYVNVELSAIPSRVGLKAALYAQDSRLAQPQLIVSNTQRGAEDKFFLGDKLAPGSYYIVVTADKEFPFNSYKLQVNKQEIIGGYRDIKGHWAMEDILKASEKGLVQGVGDYRFSPNDQMTRASVALILQRLYSYPKASSTYPYPDLSSKHWAYEAIQNISEARVMRGFSDKTFGTNKSITRAEVAVIFDRILFAGNGNVPRKPYSDVSESYWAHDSIMRLTHAGLLQGDKQGTFRPTDSITRAEFVTLVNRIRAIE